LKCLNKKLSVFLGMPRSRKFRKSQNQVKPEWGKNNPQTKAKNKKLMIYGGIIAIAVVIGASLLVMGQNGLFASPSSSLSPNPSSTPFPSASATPAATPLTSPAGEYSINGTRILLQTSMGDITLQLRDDKPITSGNFKSLVQQGKYDNTIFHRVIANFMIQGGDPTGTGYGDSSIPNIADEIGNDNVNARGTIAMANTGQPNSASSQFFINTVNNGVNSASFDSSYTVFGTVIKGMDIVDAISNVSTTGSSGSPPDKPLQTVTLIKATVLP
jgi:peptidylprolyl isomerase